MERPNASGLPRTKSDQLVETVAAAFKSPPSGDIMPSSEGGTTLSRKSSRRMMAASPGRGSGSVGKNTHIRKSRSAQLKLDLDDASGGAALSRASSASLGFSFSFTGFTGPADDIADSKPFSDDDNIPEDLEAGTTRKPKFQTEPTMPIYLKASMEMRLIYKTHQELANIRSIWSGSSLVQYEFHSIWLLCTRLALLSQFP